jgi:hypothetical protein
MALQKTLIHVFGIDDHPIPIHKVRDLVAIDLLDTVADICKGPNSKPNQFSKWVMHKMRGVRFGGRILDWAKESGRRWIEKSTVCLRPAGRELGDWFDWRRSPRCDRGYHVVGNDRLEPTCVVAAGTSDAYLDLQND